MANILAKIGLYGDPHLSSKDYGAHKEYPRESLSYFRFITEKAIELQLTHLIGLGDLSYGKFEVLEYRDAVEEELTKQMQQVNGNAYALKGNHDESTGGMTEYEFYVKKGLIKTACNLDIGKVHISVVDSGKVNSTEVHIVPDEINVILHHEFVRFTDTNMADYGKKYIVMDNMSKWFGADYIIGGHIHTFSTFDGVIVNESGAGHRALCVYPGCPSRPSYRKGAMDEVGHYIVLTIFDDGTMQFDLNDIPLWDLEDSFNLEVKSAEKQAKEEKEARVDISDVVEQLASHERNIGNPEDIIESLAGVDAKYKKKAIDLLRAGLN